MAEVERHTCPASPPGGSCVTDKISGQSDKEGARGEQERKGKEEEKEEKGSAAAVRTKR